VPQLRFNDRVVLFNPNYVESTRLCISTPGLASFNFKEFYSTTCQKPLWSNEFKFKKKNQKC